MNPRVVNTEGTIRTLCGGFIIKARDQQKSQLKGRIYDSNLLLVYQLILSCKTGGDHIWVHGVFPEDLRIQDRLACGTLNRITFITQGWPAPWQCAVRLKAWPERKKGGVNSFLSLCNPSFSRV